LAHTPAVVPCQPEIALISSLMQDAKDTMGTHNKSLSRKHNKGDAVVLLLTF
jgi:hypothetical protein